MPATGLPELLVLFAMGILAVLVIFVIFGSSKVPFLLGCLMGRWSRNYKRGLRGDDSAGGL